jgi:hypothetical protein
MSTSATLTLGPITASCVLTAKSFNFRIGKILWNCLSAAAQQHCSMGELFFDCTCVYSLYGFLVMCGRDFRAIAQTQQAYAYLTNWKTAN